VTGKGRTVYFRDRDEEWLYYEGAWVHIVIRKDSEDRYREYAQIFYHDVRDEDMEFVEKNEKDILSVAEMMREELFIRHYDMAG